jgi:deazaflavin-dependent oxidoreductase (nitroreductase family)
VPERAEGDEFHQQVIAEFRANGGRVGGYFTDIPLLLLITTGARSGRLRTTPLAYLADGERYVVVAAAGGAARNPAWYHNLVADPGVTVEVGTEVFDATAAVMTGEERDALYERFTARSPQLVGYQARTTRPIPVVVLDRRGDRASAP